MRGRRQSADARTAARRRLPPLLAVALAAGLAATAPARAAEVVVDDFATAQAQISAPPTASSFETPGTMLGNERDLTVELRSGSGSVTAEVGASGLVLDATAAADTRGRLLAAWDGVDGDADLDPVGLGGADLTDGGANNALRFTVGGLSGIAEVVVEVFTDGANSSRAAAVVGATGDVVLTFDGAAPEFVDHLGSGADFADVGAITLEVLATNSSIEITDLRAVPPALAASKVDALVNDVDMDGRADPGDTLRYTITITNTGGEATTVDLSDMVDANTTLVGGSTSSTPIAKNDLYQGVGNVTLSVDGSAGKPGLVDNDEDPDGDSFTITAFDAATVAGGTVTMVDANAGTFDYTPPAGHRGVDSFTYTIEDPDGNTATATATILLDGVVWFVDNTNSGCGSPPCGTGTQADPFQTAMQAQTASAENDIIRFREGDGTATGQNQGFVLKNGQHLVGGAADLIVGGDLIEAGAGYSVHANGGGNVLDLAADNVIAGMTLDPTTGAGVAGTGSSNATLTDVIVNPGGSGGGVSLTNHSGGFTFAASAVNPTSSTGVAVSVSGGSGSFNFAGSPISANGGGLVHVQNATAATVDFSGSPLNLANGSDDGIVLENNTGGSTVTMPLVGFVTTSSGDAVRIAGSGTVNLDSIGPVTTTAGAALDVSGTTVVKAGVPGPITVTSLAASNGAIGVHLNAVAPAVVVAGTTTISNSGAGIDLQSSGAVTFSGQLSVTTVAGAGLVAANTGAVSVPTATSSINATGGPALDATNTGLDLTFASVTANNSGGRGVSLVNTSGTTRLGAFQATTTGGEGLYADAAGTVNATSGSITTTNRAAVDVNNSATAITLTSLTSNSSTGRGIELTNLLAASTFAVTGTTTVDDAAAGNLFTEGAIHIDTVAASGVISFATTNITNRHGTGIHVDAMNGTSLGFGAVTVANPNNAGGYGIRVEGSSAPVTVASADISDTTITVAETDSNGDFVPETDGDGDAIFLKANSGKFTLNGGTLSDAGADGLDIRSSPAPDLADVTIENPGRDTAVNFGHGIQAIDLTGSGTLLRSVIRGFTQSGTDGLRVINTNTNLTSLTLDAVTVSNSCAASLPPSCGNDGVFFSSRGTSSLTLVVTDSNTLDAVPSRFTGLFGHAVQANAADAAGSTGTVNVTIENTAIENAKPGVGAAGGLNSIFLNTQFGATMNFTIQNNTIHDVARGNANGGIIQLNVQGGGSGTRTLSGSITGNVIENSTGRRGVAVDVDTASGATGNTVVDVTVENNDFNTLPDREAFTGIFTDQGSVSHDVDLTIRNNRIGTCTNTVDPCTAGNVGGSRRTVLFQLLDSTTKNVDVLLEDNTIQTNTSNDAIGVQVLDASNTFNLTALGNAVTHNGSGTDALDVTLFDPGSAVCVDLNAANVGADRNNFSKRYNLVHLDGTYRIEGLSGSQTAAAVLTFLDARNDGAAGAASTVSSFTGVASCPTP